MAGKCPHCGHDLYPFAKRCYNCGYDREELVKSYEGSGLSGCFGLIGGIAIGSAVLSFISRNYLLGFILLGLTIIFFVLSVKKG